MLMLGGISIACSMTEFMANADEARIYEEHVMRHFEQPHHRGTLSDATHRYRIENPICGDAVQIELRTGEQGMVEQAWFSGSGCIISQAAASMLTEYVEGKLIVNLQAFSVVDMLNLFRAQLTTGRRRCCLLPWQVLQAALKVPELPPPNAHRTG